MVEWPDAAAMSHRGLWRLWAVRLRPGHETAFQAVADDVLRPMFEAHAGCESVNFLAWDSRHTAVLTRWCGADAVVALHLSQRYRHAMASVGTALGVEATSAVALFPVTDDILAFSRRVAIHAARAVTQLQAGSAAPGKRAWATRAPRRRPHPSRVRAKCEHPRTARCARAVRSRQSRRCKRRAETG